MKNIRKISTYPKTLDKLPLFSNARKVAAYARVSTSSEEQLNSIESQKDYYIKMIERKFEWEFCGLYADEGMSGISHKNRVGFNKMIDDAVLDKFNLIITKSISRFARNTVDTLTCIRKLKEHGVEVYFEKEDLWTFDSKGEFMLTLLSSMAQEESRSISENVTWGQRKRFADGKYNVPFKQFLGYDKGPNGEFVVNEIQAITVRLIFKLFLEGQTPASLAKCLESLGILTPAGMKKWSQSTVVSILSNEKYKGDALLQKRFTVDFMTKKCKKNEGELPQYYVTDGHEAIVPRATFDLAQETVAERREVFARRYSSIRPLASKIQCGDCGGFYGLHISHSNNKYRTRWWWCNRKYENGCICASPRVKEDYMERVCESAFSKLLSGRVKLLDYFFELVEKSLVKNSCAETSSDRIIGIKNYITGTLLSNAKNLYITDTALSVTIKKILATVESHLVFEFIDGEKVDVLFDLKDFR